MSTKVEQEVLSLLRSPEKQPREEYDRMIAKLRSGFSRRRNPRYKLLRDLLRDYRPSRPSVSR